MKSKILHGFLLVLIAALLLSCKPRELPKEKEVVTITKTITEVKRDTIIQVKADSSFYEAYIECQNGKPILLQNPNFQSKEETFLITEGKYLQTPKVNLSDAGKLKISCQYLANQLKITLKEKQVLEEKLTEKITVPPPLLIEKQLSWWQKLWLTLGKVFSASFLIFLILKIPWKALLKP